MFHVKNHKQGYIFDPWSHLGPKRRQLLATSWSGLFLKEILPDLPVESLRSHYHDWNGRPTKELHSMIGMMILQQMHNLTDEEAIEQFCFNIQWHYALNITSPDDAASYISGKSIWTMRDKLSTEEAYNDIFAITLKRLAEIFTVDFSKQRIDSVHVQSNMRHLGRIGIFVKTIKNFLNNLKRQHPSLFGKLDKDLVKRYLSKNTESLFASVKPSDSSHTLDQLATDIHVLTERFSQISAVENMSTLKQLVRLFKEQCIIENNDDFSDPKASAKPNKDVPSDSLQNPSDPDAGYSGHKGKGYQAQVAENYTESTDSAEEEKHELSLITHIDVESADKHDANALLPAIEELEKKGITPQEFLADSLYGSTSNCDKAKNDHGVEVIAPLMPGNQKYFHLSLFTFDNGGCITSCPCGVTPQLVKPTRKGYSAAFPLDTCLSCESFDACPVKKGSKAYYYRYTADDVTLAHRKRYEESSEFKDRYRYRAGAEATMSELDRRTGVKHLRVRGMKAVRFAVFMKAIGLNIFRAARHQKLTKPERMPRCVMASTVELLVLLFKDQVSQQNQILSAKFEKLCQLLFQRQEIQI